jgi:hypothetical protein
LKTEAQGLDCPGAAPALTTPAPDEGRDAFDTLLLKPRPESSPGHPQQRVEGIAVGSLVQLLDTTAPTSTWAVNVPELGLVATPAMSMVQLESRHNGHAVAVGFEGGDIARPIVLGLMMTSSAPVTADAPDHRESQQGQVVSVTRDGQKVRIEAETELELRCGEAVILLGRDGQIHIRGAYVTSHATASQRIRGGSVQIN